jgi:hypothetical protein
VADSDRLCCWRSRKISSPAALDVVGVVKK